MTITNPHLMNIRETASSLQLSPKTVLSLIKTGQISIASQNGNDILIEESVVKDFLTQIEGTRTFWETTVTQTIGENNEVILVNDKLEPITQPEYTQVCFDTEEYHHTWKTENANQLDDVLSILPTQKTINNNIFVTQYFRGLDKEELETFVYQQLILTAKRLRASHILLNHINTHIKTP